MEVGGGSADTCNLLPGGELMSGAALELRRSNGAYYRRDKVAHAQSHAQQMVSGR